MKDNICDQIDFILKGGLWEKIAEQLVELIPSALIVEIKNEDIVVIEAVNVELDRLVFKDKGNELLSCTPKISPINKLYFDNFSIPPISLLEEWTNAIRFHGKSWDIYVLIKETPSQDLIYALRPYLKVIELWISLRSSPQLEERLSSLSYMILATKNTLTSIFEPMSIEYFAEFLRGVLKEILLTKKIAVYIDDGFSITLLKGDDFGTPLRSGIFASKMLSPTPIVFKDKEVNEIGLDFQFVSGKSGFIMPITYTTTDKFIYRLFCIGVLEKPNTQEMLDFLELLGNVASKALEIRNLHMTTEENIRQLDSKSYTAVAFYNVLKKLVSCKERIELFSFLLSFFIESSQAERVKLVVYDPRACKYFLIGESLGGIAAQCFDPLTDTMERISGNGEGEIDESQLAIIGFKFKDMPKCKAYPLWIGDKLEGFVALHNIAYNNEISDYPVVFEMLCQLAARELHFRLTC